MGMLLRRLGGVLEHFCRHFECLSSRCVPVPAARFSTDEKEYQLPSWVESDARHLSRTLDACKENIRNRKGHGDAEKVADIWRRLQARRRAEEAGDIGLLERQLHEEVAKLPNWTHRSSPVGDESPPTVVNTVGAPPDFQFPIRSHVQLGRELGIIRYDANLAYATGGRSYYLLGAGALFEEALVRYSLEKLHRKGFELISVPDVISREVFEGCGVQSEGIDSWLYHLDHGELCLSGTAEVGIASQFVDQVLAEESLPLGLCAVSPCYRAEVGAREGASLYRVHQFTKVEMFVFTAAGESQSALDRVVAVQQEILAELGLHYRLLDMPARELGAPAHRKYDAEVWMPYQGRFGEVSSASDCTDYQGKRLNMRYRRRDGRLAPLHTVNGTACAVPRLLLSLFEYNQRPEGAIAVPAVLQPYMEGISLIEKRHGLSPPHFCRF